MNVQVKSRYFWLLNLIVIIAVLGFSSRTALSNAEYSPYLFKLNEVPHYVTAGFSLDADPSEAVEVPAGSNVDAVLHDDIKRVFLHPGEMLYAEFTITAQFDYSSQYDELVSNTHITPGLNLPGLGDSYEIYLNGHKVASEWHVDDGRITLHKLARSKVYTLSPSFFVRGINTLTFRVYGDVSTIDTGLTVTGKYAIDDFSRLRLFNYSQIIFAGVCLAVAIMFIVFFVLYHEKKLNLWFSVTALSISLYAFFRSGALINIFPDYSLALRLEVLSLFAFAYFITVSIYTCGKARFNIAMKLYTGIYAVCSAAVLLPGQQFILDLVKIYLILCAPYLVYSFISSLLIPLVSDVKKEVSEGQNVLSSILIALSDTLHGNMLIGSFFPIVLALFDQLVYVRLSYLEIMSSQYGFLFFFANVTFAVASDNAEAHGKLMEISGELRTLVNERESELALKSGEIEEVKTSQLRFMETVAKEIRAPLVEIIGAAYLKTLSPGLTDEMTDWLNRLLEAQRDIRTRLDGFLGYDTEHEGSVSQRYNFDAPYGRYGGTAATADHSGTRHLFVINPKSFITLMDLKNFLLSIEMCFSVGHRAEYKVYISRYPRDAYSAVHRYLSATPPDETARVYAVGGDGVLFDCLNGLAKFPNAELAPIPYGSANDFARSFGAGNVELFRDIKLMCKSPSRAVDLILCGEHFALCGCSIGIEAKAVQTFSNIIEKISSSRARYFVPLIYKLGGLKALLNSSHSNISYNLTIDGVDYSGDYLFLNIGNIALNGGSNIPNPLAIPDDGMLDIIFCKPPTLLNSLRMFPSYTKGQFEKFPDHLKHFRLKELHCESDSLLSVILDGETFYTHNLDLKILPKAVKIVSPNGIGFADFSGAAQDIAK